MKRKIKLLNGEIQSYWMGGERNPCGCGSNVFHLENDEYNTYGVCNSCKLDIYLYDEQIEFDEWKWK